VFNSIHISRVNPEFLELRCN